MRNEAPTLSRCRQVALALLAVAWISAPVLGADLYRIDGVAVDAVAESGVAARQIAIANGQREGLTRMMRRLTSPADHGRLPDVATVPIERFVNSFEIAEEKVGPNQYLGVINMNFIAAQVQGLLSSAGIPYVTRRSDPILVVPVSVTGGQPDAWAESSPWRNAWFAAIEDATIVVVALPLGDLADLAGAPPGSLLAGDPAVLEALGVRYGATTVIVATATAADPELTGPVQIELRRADDWMQPIFRTTVETRRRQRCRDDTEGGCGSGNPRDRGRLEATHRGPSGAGIHGAGDRATCRPCGLGPGKARPHWLARGAIGDGHFVHPEPSRDNDRPPG